MKSISPADQVAIAIVEHMMIPDAETGRVGQLKYSLPPRIAFLQRMRVAGILPTRILSEFERQLAIRHEANRELEAAKALYKSIVARPSGGEVPNTPEQIKAQLRLAAIAEAEGRSADSKAILAEIGLSPDQCSIYQSRPAMQSFKHPDYSGAMIREASEGRILFEFDLDKEGVPSNLRVTQASPPFLFDRKTLDSFRAARFAPVTNGTEALACKGAEQSFIWRLPN